eukprot:Seg478.6 transcript_id=Seg478.6/GoldUCD/mRNA.D3Y31 product="KN motif and ankyrin repeat domain-containing protein 1" protein_id=Seg478.6/GoldUCD/D3Y31
MAEIDSEQTLDGLSLNNAKEQSQLFPVQPDQLTSSLNRPHSPSSTASRLSSDYSSDVESTTSSAVVRRRPARPRIHLSSASLSDLSSTREDDFLSLKAYEPLLTSEKVADVQAQDSHRQKEQAATMPDRPDSADSSTSYLNLVEETFAMKSFAEDSSDLSPTFEGLKITAYEPKSENISKQSETRIYEGFRSKSPTSKLLQPLFQHAMSEDIYKALQTIRSEIQPKLSRLRKVEDENKLLAVLQVKLAVLQEEKRQLLNMLKQKRTAKQSISSLHSSTGSSPQSSPVSFQSETNDDFLIRPCPQRAKLNKDTQTEICGLSDSESVCPMCRRSIDESPKEIVSDEIIAEADTVLAESAPSQDSSSDILESHDLDTKVVEIPLKTEKILIDVGVQHHLDVCHAETATSEMKLKDMAVGDGDAVVYTNNASTETEVKTFTESSTGDDIVEKLICDVSTQESIAVSDMSSQIDESPRESKSAMAGCACSELVSTEIQCSPCCKDASFGDELAEKILVDKEAQLLLEVEDKGVQNVVNVEEKSIMCGNGFQNIRSISVEAHVPTVDFMCGDGQAMILTSTKSCQQSIVLQDVASSPVEWETNEFGACCNLDAKEAISIGIGDDTTTDLLCDHCANIELVSVGVGVYGNIENAKLCEFSDNLCRIDDKLCDCLQPDLCDVGIGDSFVNNVICDLCKNRECSSVACGEDRIDDTFCDKCEHLQLETKSCGEGDVNIVLCDECLRKGETHEIGVGENDVFETGCAKCEKLNQTTDFVNVSMSELEPGTPYSNGHERRRRKSETLAERRTTSISSETEFCEEVYKIMANTTISTEVQQEPVICNYCGNKVDLNDKNLDMALIAMRNNLGSYTRNGLDGAKGLDNLAVFDDYVEGVEEHISSESDDEDMSESIKNDIVESCKMLQQHLSGEKPLKQQLMLKYLANIEALWFQTVKRKRANAAVVKSYIDLFKSRIPELLDTIINLMDQDGNTALHFALTYRNTGVVSILLDSQECKVDFHNKAGYSPIMLAALAGFDNKTDKYVMQRLLRAGDINCKNRESGQTPLMLAVSRSHAGMVELLLDAGADINESDNDGSTALMCACENGSMPLVKMLLSNPDCDATAEDHEGSTSLSIAMDAKRRDLALLIYGSLNFDARGRIKLTPSRQSLLGLGTRRSPSPAVGKI